MAYFINIEKEVVKALDKLNEPYYSAVKEAIKQLAYNPRPYGYRKLRGHSAYRITVSSYRIIYEIIDNILRVNVIELGHRSSVYKQL
jgi:mRNA interferase RelE/StbE